MRWPIAISIYSHEMIVNHLTSQVSDLKRERELLWDRLATIGLGGPLFNGPSPQDSSQNIATEEEITSSEDEELRYLEQLKRTPSKYAAAITTKLYRDYNKRGAAPSVARIPDPRMTAALDEAEAKGRQQHAG